LQIEAGMTLHPSSVALLKEIAENEAPGWNEIPVNEGREIFNSFVEMFGEGPEVREVRDIQIRDDLKARLYHPEPDQPLPAIIYFHGGGWVLGNLDTHDALCRHLAAAAGRAVLAVDYRLAPEHRYPAAVEDSFDATKFASENATQLGIKSDKIAVAGDSAGGNLAAAAALRARDESGPRIESQVLIYPVIEPNFDSDTYRAFGVDHMLTQESMRWFWQQYLGDLDDAKIAQSTFAVLTENQLENLPPALVLTAEYDVLRSEGERFAEMLRKAGNEVNLQQFDGMLHGFVHFSGIFEDGLKAIARIAKFLT
jgi:acetyl esterase